MKICPYSKSQNFKEASYWSIYLSWFLSYQKALIEHKEDINIQDFSSTFKNKIGMGKKCVCKSGEVCQKLRVAKIRKRLGKSVR